MTPSILSFSQTFSLFPIVKIRLSSSENTFLDRMERRKMERVEVFPIVEKKQKELCDNNSKVKGWS